MRNVALYLLYPIVRAAVQIVEYATAGRWIPLALMSAIGFYLIVSGIIQTFHWIF